jgi:hypothetical protein
MAITAMLSSIVMSGAFSLLAQSHGVVQVIDQRVDVVFAGHERILTSA